MATEYKLKGLTGVNLKNGQKQEVEVEGIDQGKILLAKLNNEVHALSPKCTHYGAPLVKGVLTPDGRLTCPWHGACFKLATGDVEDAPALDPLAKFEVIQKDGGVYIKADESVVKASRRTLNFKCTPKGQEHVVVVGGGSGAVGAIEGLRANKFDGKITCISEENGHLPIDRTKLSKALMTDASALQWRKPAFYEEGGVDMVHASVSSIDFPGEKVQTKDGKQFTYTKLILASGGVARMLPLPGLKGDLKNVFPLRSIADVQNIMKAAGGEGGKKIVVIGSSFIGMEAGNALAGKKHHVTIVGMESEPLERVMGAQVGSMFRKILEKNGVTFHMNAQVQQGDASSSGNGTIGSVSLKDGTSLPADIVIEGVGIRPATDYLQNNPSITLEKDGSLAVDRRFAVPGLPHVYAIGDIATYPYHGPDGDGHPVRIEHWNVAQNAGRRVAQTLTAPATAAAPPPFIPIFWSALGAQLRYCGHTPHGFDDVLVRGTTAVRDDANPSFVAYYTRANTVVAVASMQRDPCVVQAAELMRVGRMLGKAGLLRGADGADPVDVLGVALQEGEARM